MVRSALRMLFFCSLASAAAALSPLELAQTWQDYGPRERYEALQNYRRHERLTRERRQDVERNYQRWRKLPEPERDRIRENFELFQRLPLEQRKELRRRYQGKAQ